MEMIRRTSRGRYGRSLDAGDPQLDLPGLPACASCHLSKQADIPLKHIDMYVRRPM